MIIIISLHSVIMIVVSNASNELTHLVMQRIITHECTRMCDAIVIIAITAINE